MDKQGILFVSSYTHHRPLANAACLVAGAIVISLAIHPHPAQHEGGDFRLLFKT
jgi:ADP-ribosylglycohydrolase